jgi:hypothetical protein
MSSPACITSAKNRYGKRRHRGRQVDVCSRDHPAPDPLSELRRSLECTVGQRGSDPLVPGGHARERREVAQIRALKSAAEQERVRKGAAELDEREILVRRPGCQVIVEDRGTRERGALDVRSGEQPLAIAVASGESPCERRLCQAAELGCESGMQDGLELGTDPAFEVAVDGVRARLRFPARAAQLLHARAVVAQGAGEDRSCALLQPEGAKREPMGAERHLPAVREPRRERAAATQRESSPPLRARHSVPFTIVAVARSSRRPNSSTTSRSSRREGSSGGRAR